MKKIQFLAVSLILKFSLSLESQIQVTYQSLSSYSVAQVYDVVKKDDLNWLALCHISFPPNPIPKDFKAILKTLDGGVNWTVTYSLNILNPLDMHNIVYNEDTVVAFGADQLFKSTDFGSSWSLEQKPQGQFTFTRVKFMPGNKIWITGAGTSSAIWETTSDFSSFNQKTPIINGGLWGDFSDFSTDTFAVPLNSNGKKDIYKTFNGGTTWQIFPLPMDDTLNARGMPTGANYITYIKYHDREINNATIFYSPYINHVFYTTNGFTTIRYDTVLYATMISDWITCPSKKEEYLFHSVVDGRTSYLLECKKQNNGRLILGQTTNLNRYCWNLSFSGNSFIAGGEGEQITKGTGLCSELLNTYLDEEDKESYIFPNPVTNEIKVDFNSSRPKHWTVTDLTGKTLRSGYSGTIQIDVSDLENGIYILQVNTKQSIRTEKIIKIN